MSIIKIAEKENYTLVIWKIEEDINNLLNQLNPNKKELKEIHRFKNINRKKQNIISRLMLNHLANKKVILHYSEKGVPSCNVFKYISISHSKNYCTVIISQNKIGIDIQYYKTNMLEISPKFINQKEKITSNNNKEKLHFIWCAKEAIYKTLHGINCSFKENIYIEKVKNKSITTGYYNSMKNSVKYDVYCEKFETYFIAIAIMIS